MAEENKAGKHTDNNAEKDTGQKANPKVSPSAFIRQVAVAGSNADRQAAMPASMQADSSESNDADMPNSMDADKPKESKKKKGQSANPDYESLFLARNELSNRQGLYIDKENYEVLQTLVRSIRTERLSVSGLVDNIIKHHIELYGDEINRIFEENIRKPIK